MVGVVAPWYARPGIKRLDASSLKQISELNNSSGLDSTFQLVERQHDGLGAYAHLFEGKYYASCITVWINKQAKTYSLSCEFADIQGVFTTRNGPMSVSLLDVCDLAMSQIVEWLQLGILQPRPFQFDSTQSVVDLLAELDKEVLKSVRDCEDDESVPIVVFVPVYPCKVGFQELERHFKVEADMAAKSLNEAGIGSVMDQLTLWMTQKDELRAFVLSWDCDPAQGWMPLDFWHSKL